MKPLDYDSLSDIEQYYGFDLNYKAHRTNQKKLIINIGLFLVVVAVVIML
ncbi:MAG: hypothetical protein HWQ35_06925 [Nostoc sp. NMS1]|nr:MULTISPECIES: hypothetical protein [unclassified Nostoc]MBN3906289.1 hypothetical protein [Nostoc sp. NMS1]MBN3992002.1 hypothetical protein [Nostoc sp. NMS2]